MLTGKAQLARLLLTLAVVEARTPAPSYSFRASWVLFYSVATFGLLGCNVLDQSDVPGASLPSTWEGTPVAIDAGTDGLAFGSIPVAPSWPFEASSVAVNPGPPALQLSDPIELGVDLGWWGPGDTQVDIEADSSGDLHVIWLPQAIGEIHYKKVLLSQWDGVSAVPATDTEMVPNANASWSFGPPHLAVDHQGVVHLTWITPDLKSLWYTERLAGGWAAPTELVHVPAECHAITEPNIAVGPDGVARVSAAYVHGGDPDAPWCGPYDSRIQIYTPSTNEVQDYVNWPQLQQQRGATDLVIADNGDMYLGAWWVDFALLRKRADETSWTVVQNDACPGAWVHTGEIAVDGSGVVHAAHQQLIDWADPYAWSKHVARYWNSEQTGAQQCHGIGNPADYSLGATPVSTAVTPSGRVGFAWRDGLYDLNYGDDWWQHMLRAPVRYVVIDPQSGQELLGEVPAPYSDIGVRVQAVAIGEVLAFLWHDLHRGLCLVAAYWN